jgi:DNA helicase-2/ATP-dependent DNA helicase PcrA
MGNDVDGEVGRVAAGAIRGSVIAAAGCGKTETISRALLHCSGRRLVLTHTHAGVDALFKRLLKHQVPAERYCLDTIAGWCLRFVLAFPVRSALSTKAPHKNDEWTAVYQGVARLLDTGAIDKVLQASYTGLFVDEYQDCTKEQHNVIRRLAQRLPTCVFGDPLQSIFDFAHQTPVNWDADVFPSFPNVGQLTTPWRWKNAGSNELAEWLKDVRLALEAGTGLSLGAETPSCILWSQMPGNEEMRIQAIAKQCLEALNAVGTSQNLIVIGDGVNSGSRAALARSLSKQYFSTIEPVNCRELYTAAKAWEGAPAEKRWPLVLKFVRDCMTGSEQAELKKALASKASGGKKGVKKFGETLINAAHEACEAGSDLGVLAFLQTIDRHNGVRVYRREMFHAMCAALRSKAAGHVGTLVEGVWQAQNRIRHAGRKFGKYSVGSTLLVKGLEFDHAIIAETSPFDKKDWYVALTRAAVRVRIVSASKQLMAPKEKSESVPSTL